MRKHLVALIAATLLSTTAVASEDFTLERFAPATDMYGVLDVESPWTGLPWETNAWLNWSYRPLSLYNRNKDSDNYVGSYVGERLTLHLTGSVPLASRWQLGAELPVVLQQRRHNRDNLGLGRLSSSGFGDLRLVPKWNFHSDLAFLPIVTVPTASSGGRSFLGENSLSFTPTLAAFQAVGKLHLMGNAGVMIRRDRELSNLDVNEELQLSGAARYFLTPKVNLLAGLSSATSAQSFFKKNTNYLEAQAGVEFEWLDMLSTTVAAGTGFTEGYGTPNQRIMVTTNFIRKPPKKVFVVVPVPVYIEQPVPEPVVLPPVPRRDYIVYFDFDKADIRPDAQATLDEAAARILAWDEDVRFGFEIAGFADKRGANAYNMELGLRRAEAVKAYLVDAGVEAARLYPVSTFGEEICDSDGTEESRQLCRRVNLRTVVFDKETK